MVGYDPSIITSDPLGSELEALESIAAGLSPGIQANNRRLREMGRFLRGAGWLLIAAPVLGAAAYLNESVLISLGTEALRRFQ